MAYGRGVLEQRVRPRHQVRVVRIGRGVDRVAAGGGDDAPLVAVLRAGRGAHHPQGRALAAAGARAGPAGVDVRLLLEHHVDEQVVADVLLVDGPDVLEVAVALARLGHDLVGLGDHLQGVVVADGDALGAALALGRVDDDLEHAADAAPSSCRRRSTSWSSTTASRYISRSASGMVCELLLPLGLGEHLAEDGGVGALGHAVHAAGAVLGMYSGISGAMLLKSRSVAVPAGTSERASGQVGGQVVLAVALLVAADDALVEVGDVEHRQADQLVGAVDEGAVAVVVERVVLGGLVHGRRGDGCGNHNG